LQPLCAQGLPQGLDFAHTTEVAFLSGEWSEITL
jgi:hypothetical protein